MGHSHNLELSALPYRLHRAYLSHGVRRDHVKDDDMVFPGLTDKEVSLWCHLISKEEPPISLSAEVN